MIKRLLDKWKQIPLPVKASVSYTVCSVLQKCLSFITLPLFTRLLTTEQYGQYTVYLSWSTIFTIFITLYLAYGSFSTAMIKFEKKRMEYIAAIQNLVALLGAVFLIIYYPLRRIWNPLLNMPTGLVILMVVEIVAQFALSCWYQIKQFEYKYKSSVAVTLAMAVLMPVAAYVLVTHSEEKGYARILGYAIVNVIAGLILYISAAIKGKGGLEKKYWKYALSFNIPLIPYYLSQSIFNQSDRIMIDHICGTDKAAIYGVAYTLAMLLTFVLNAINHSYLPWFYGKIREGKERENRNVATGIAALIAFMFLGVIALAPEIIVILAGEDYREAIWVVPPVAMSVVLLFYSQLSINVEFFYEKKTLLVWGSVGSAVLNVLLNWWLIPIFGFEAAGYTTLVSYIAFAVANYYTMRYAVKDKPFSIEAYDIKALLTVLAVFMALSFAATALYNYPLIRFSIILLVFIALFIFRKPAIAFVRQTLVQRN